MVRAQCDGGQWLARVADRGLPSLDNIDELAARGDRRLECILAVPARRHAELVETFRALAFDAAGLAEASFAGHRLIVAHDPLRTEEQTARRRARIAELEAMAERMVAGLDAQGSDRTAPAADPPGPDGNTARGRRASDRGAHGRFCRAVAEAEMTRVLEPDLQADRFSWSMDEAAVAEAQLFDGRLALITNAADRSPADAVRRYKDLADIERVRVAIGLEPMAPCWRPLEPVARRGALRVLKSDIEIAPVHHRLPDRIRAHALICFLALVLWRVMRLRRKAKGHTASPRTALDLLARIQRHQARIGERAVDGLSTTTPEQLEHLNTLNLPKPA